MKGAVETEWLATVSQAGEEHMVLDAESGEVTIDDAEHLEALDYYTSLALHAPSGAAQLDWAGAQNSFYQGQLAMMRFWGHAYTGTPEDSVVKDSIGVAPMIARPRRHRRRTGRLVPLGADRDRQAGGGQGLRRLRLREQRALHGFVARPRSAHLGLRVEAGRGGGSRVALLETLNAPQTLARPATPHWQEIVDTVLTPVAEGGGARRRQRRACRGEGPDRGDRRVQDRMRSTISTRSAGAAHAAPAPGSRLARGDGCRGIRQPREPRRRRRPSRQHAAHRALRPRRRPRG